MYYCCFTGNSKNKDIQTKCYDLFIENSNICKKVQQFAISFYNANTYNRHEQHMMYAQLSEHISKNLYDAYMNIDITEKLSVESQYTENEVKLCIMLLYR
jgi:hypothetical protein